MRLDERHRLGHLGEEREVDLPARVIGDRHHAEELAQGPDRRRIRRENVRDDPIVIEALDGHLRAAAQHLPRDSVVGVKGVGVDRVEAVENRAAEVGVGLGALERGNRQAFQGQALPRPRPQIDLQLPLPDVFGDGRQRLRGIGSHPGVAACNGRRSQYEQNGNGIRRNGLHRVYLPFRVAISSFSSATLTTRCSPSSLRSVIVSLKMFTLITRSYPRLVRIFLPSRGNRRRAST